MTDAGTSHSPDDSDWVGRQLADVVEELRSLPQFVTGMQTGDDVRVVLEHLSALTDATRELVRHVPAWYRTNADQLYSRKGVYGAEPTEAMTAQIDDLEVAKRTLTEAEVRLLGAARKAEDLGLRGEQEVDPFEPGSGVEEWWVIEEQSFDLARTPTLVAYETREAALWHAGHLADQVDRNSELVVRPATAKGRGEEVARMRGRADISG